MMTKYDAEMLKAYMTASWMGIVHTVTGEGGCETCGYGAPEYNHIELNGLHQLVDDFLASPDNKEQQPQEPRKPLTQDRIRELVRRTTLHPAGDSLTGIIQIEEFVRRVERAAHGIGEGGA